MNFFVRLSLTVLAFHFVFRLETAQPIHTHMRREQKVNAKPWLSFFIRVWYIFLFCMRWQKRWCMAVGWVDQWQAKHIKLSNMETVYALCVCTSIKNYNRRKMVGIKRHLKLNDEIMFSYFCFIFIARCYF